MLLAIAAMSYLSMSYSYGPGSGGAGDRTSSPMNGYSTCSNGSACHTSAGSFTPSTTVQLLNGSTPVTSYVAGTTYTVRISVSSSTGVTSSTRYSFQIVSVQSSTNNAVNVWGTPPSGTHSVTIGGRNYIEHSSALSSGTINIPWTAPSTATGNITFYCTGNVVNNNYNETGDNCASTTLTVTPSTGGCTSPALSTSVTNVLCKGDSTGTILLNTTGGTSPFLFAWSGPGGYQSISQNITGLAAGTYNVTVTATGGCTATTSATITEPATKLTTSTNSNSPLCAGGTLNLGSTNSGGTGAYTYLWNGPGGYSNSNSTGILSGITTTMSGKYIFTIHDANGCTAKDTENIVISAKPNADSINANAASGQTYNFLGINVTGSPKYNWDFGDSKTDTIIAPSHTYSASGMYTVRLILSNSCGNDTLYKHIYIALAGIENTVQNSTWVTLYPNPAHGYFNIRSNESIAVYKVVLYNLSGIKMQETIFNNNSTTVCTAKLTPGLYLVHIETGSGSLVKKLQIE